MRVVIGITGAKKHPEKIKEVTSVYVQYKKFNNFSFITFISICLNLEIITITYSFCYPMSNLRAFSKAFIKA